MQGIYLLGSKLFLGIWNLFLNLNIGNFNNNASENVVEVGENSLLFNL